MITLKQTTTAKELLDQKGHGVISISPSATVYDAIKKMADNDVGSLVVTNDITVVGILTERHYARNVVLKGLSSPATPVQAVMETNVVYAEPEQSIEECMAIMTNKKIRHLPVMENGSLIGIISIGDLVHAIIERQKFAIEQLEHFIHQFDP
jgi:CBS domain-containing protein